MEPVPRERLPGGGLALRDFVFMMRKRQVDATRVNVQRVSQIFHGHRGALDVPARPAGPDWRFPEVLTGLRRFPQGEIPSAFFFVAIIVDARAGLNSRQVNLRELSVA